MASDVSPMTPRPAAGDGHPHTRARPGFENRKPESLGLRIQHVLHARPILGPLAVLLLSIIAFSIISGRFLSAANLGLVLAQVTVIAVLALGQTLVILTAGIDLSTGAITVFTSVIMANLTTKAGLPGGLALIVGFLCGLAMGCDQRPAGHPAQAAAVHRHARHAQHLLLAELGGEPQRDHPRLGHAADHDVDG